MSEPREGVVQRRGREPAGDGASGLCARNEAGVGQDVEMLHDRRQRNVERRFQRADRKPGLAGEPQHQRAPRRVGKCRKGAIEGGGVKVNHVVNYSRGAAVCQPLRAAVELCGRLPIAARRRFPRRGGARLDSPGARCHAQAKNFRDIMAGTTAAIATPRYRQHAR